VTEERIAKIKIALSKRRSRRDRELVEVAGELLEEYLAARREVDRLRDELVLARAAREHSGY